MCKRFVKIITVYSSKSQQLGTKISTHVHFFLLHVRTPRFCIMSLHHALHALCWILPIDPANLITLRELLSICYTFIHRSLAYLAQLHPSKSFESLKKDQYRWKPSKLRLAVQKLQRDFGSYPSGAKQHLPILIPRVCQPLTARLFDLELRGFCYLIVCFSCGGRVAGLVLIRLVCRDVEGEVLR
jgi:hypothetical protein